MNEKRIFADFVSKLVDSQQKLQPEFAKIINDNFWDLVSCDGDKKMPEIVRFKVTQEHILLAKNMNVSWCDFEWGAPCIDPKRPYGNSDVESDICRILDKKKMSNGEYSQIDLKKAGDLHKDMEKALQIFLCTKSFKIGLYEMREKYDSTSWRLVKSMNPMLVRGLKEGCLNLRRV